MGRDGQDQLLGPRPGGRTLVDTWNGSARKQALSHTHSPLRSPPPPLLLPPTPTAGSDTQGHPVLQGPHRHGPLRGAGRHRRPRRRLQREREERLQTVQQRQRGDPHFPGQEARGEAALAAGLPRGEEDGAGGRENRSVTRCFFSSRAFFCSASIGTEVTFQPLHRSTADVCRGPSLIRSCFCLFVFLGPV